MGAVAALLPDGRLHLQHGPIDLLIMAEARADGPSHSAYRAARDRFRTMLDEIVSELPLLRKPLPAAWGGLPHFGRDGFASPADPAFVVVRDWLASEGPVGAPPALNARETQFGAEVQPVLLASGCANANCHGVDAAVPFRLDGGVGGAQDVATTRANYHEAIAMLALAGDPLQSRLLRKALPLHAGGIVHKGGNAGFFTGPDDARVEAIVDWVCSERQARLGEACVAAGEPAGAASIDGFVFVRGPLQPRDCFDLDAWSPGTDIWRATVDGDSLAPTAVVNLTDGLTGAAADARDPAVDARGERLAFSLRTAADAGHRIAILDLADGAVRLVTGASDATPGETGGDGVLPGGGLRSDRDPTWGPRGHVWFVSNRAGVIADDGRRLDAELYELDPDTGAVTRRTFTPHIERKPVFFALGTEAGGEVAFTALRDVFADQRRAHIFRFPPDLGSEYHQHFGITPPENLFYDMRELPDGRYVVTIGDLSGVWRGGRLGVVDRNFGPEIPGGSGGATAGETPASLPFYADPLTRLDETASARGLSAAGIYRDAAPLPDGRLLVAYALAPVDLASAATVPDLRIEWLRLEERVGGGGPRIVERAVLVDAPGLADRDPEPILRRQPIRVAAIQHWDPSATTGILRHQGLPIIDALIGHLPPTGSKQPRDDLRYVRLVEALPTTASTRTPVADGDDSGDDDPELGWQATTTSLAPHGPARILAELPLADDGTFQVELPAGVPFRIQALDANRMVVGTPHNRWFYAAPGQTVPQGVPNAATYASRCAACHGALDGAPSHVFVEPDILTAASLTLGRYQGQNPRRPIAPTLVGDATRVAVDFRRDVRPLLNRSCAVAGCHAGAAAAGDLDLSATATPHFDRAYEALLRRGEGSLGGFRYVDALHGSGRGSWLVELLTGQELDAPRPCATPGQVHPGPEIDVPPLSDAERQTIVRWIELGASWSDGQGDAP